MNAATIKARYQTALAALQDLEAAGHEAAVADRQPAADGDLTDVGKLVRELVIDCDRVTYQRDVAERACRELRVDRDALNARIAELMDLVDEGDREAANIDTSLSNPQAGKLLVVRIDASDADLMRECTGGGGYVLRLGRSQFVGWLEGPQDEGDTETKPHDDILSTPLAAELKAKLTGGADVIAKPHPGPMTFDPKAKIVATSGALPLLTDVSHAGLTASVIERCTSCKAIAGRGHLSDCSVGAIVGGAA